jgi:hypothetical protein
MRESVPTEAGLWSSRKFPRRSNTKIPIIGDIAGSAAPPFAQISFGSGLQAPCECGETGTACSRISIPRQTVPGISS